MVDKRCLIINVYVLLSPTVLDHMVITAIIKEGRAWVFDRGVNNVKYVRSLSFMSKLFCIITGILVCLALIMINFIVKRGFR